MEGSNLEHDWHRRAHKVRRLINQTWIFTYFAPAFLCGSSCGLVWILTARSLFIGEAGIFLPVVGIVMLSLLLAYLLVRSNFISYSQALEVLDEKYKMRNRVSSALDGALPWPTVPIEVERAVKVKIRKPLIQVCTGFLLLFLATVVPPFRDEGARISSPTVKPLSLTKAEALVEQLTDKELLSPETLADMHSKISELSKKTLDEQYEHHALEAADSLQESLQREVSKLAQKLEQANREAKNAQSNLQQGNNSEAQSHQKTFEKLAQELLSGSVSPNDEMKKALRQALQNESKLMSPEASEALRKQMQDLKEQLKSAQESVGKKGKTSGSAHGGKDGKDTSESGEGRGERVHNSGKAGVSRGGEHSVPVDVEKPPQLTSARVEQLGAAPRPIGTPGELIGLSSQQPEVGTPLPIGKGGSTLKDTEGGKALERQNLTPEEAELVQRLYK